MSTTGQPSECILLARGLHPVGIGTHWLGVDKKAGWGVVDESVHGVGLVSFGRSGNSDFILGDLFRESESVFCWHIRG